MTGKEAERLVENGTPCQWKDKSGLWHDCLITPGVRCAFQEGYEYRITPNGYDLPVGMKVLYRCQGSCHHGEVGKIIERDESSIPYYIEFDRNGEKAWATRECLVPIKEGNDGRKQHRLIDAVLNTAPTSFPAGGIPVKLPGEAMMFDSERVMAVSNLPKRHELDDKMKRLFVAAMEELAKVGDSIRRTKTETRADIRKRLLNL